MKVRKNRIFVILLSFALMLTMVPAMASPSFAADGGWITNSDGTVSISESEVDEVLSKNTNVTMVNIGTKGGSIVKNSLPNGAGIITETDSSNTVAMVLYTSVQNKGTVKTMIKNLKFSGSTTQIHLDVSDGSTSISVDPNDKTFGILNSNGEAHAYKLVKYASGADKSWFAAYKGAVQGAGTLGGMKGYLATVTTSEEATLLKKFYDSVAEGSTNGAWIAATSMKYSTNTNTTYEKAGKISPSNYGYPITDSTVANQGNNPRFKASGGAYYLPFSGSPVSASSYYSSYYWADGPEAGQQVPTNLWCSGEPNNSDSGRYGEYCVVASYNNNVNFNDFAPYNTNPIGYFLEFSTYDGGTAGGVNKNSYTISRVKYDGNGNTSGTVPATQAKVSSSNLTLATNSGSLAKTGYKFSGWNTNKTGTGTRYSAGGSYTMNEALDLYADWAPVPKITTQPGDLTMTYGYKDKKLSVAASVTDSHTLSYQWYSNTTNSNTGGTAVSGATSASYTIPTTQKAGDYYYYCVVKATKTNTNHQQTTTSNAVKVTINKANPTLSGISATAITYGNKLSASTITGTAKHPESSAAVAGTWTFTNPDTKPGAGTANQSVTFTPNDTANYNTVTGTASVTVNKAAISPEVTMDGWTYGEDAKSPEVTGNPGNGDVTYTYYTDSGCTTKTTVDGSGASAAGGKPANAGQYYVKAAVGETANYKAGSATSSFRIERADIGTPAVDMPDYTYEGTKPAPSISNFPGGGKVTYYYSTENASQDGTAWSEVADSKTLDAGTYYMYATVDQTANYNSYTTATKKFTINKADIAPTVTQANWIYGNAATAPVIGGNPENGAATLTYYTDEACTSKTTAAADGASEEGKQPVYAGEYYVKAQIAETTNYNGAVTKDPDSFTIEKRPVTVSGITTTDKVYDGKTGAALDYSDMKLENQLPNDNLTAVADGVFVDEEGNPDRNVGENKTVKLSNLRLDGNSKANYKLAETGQQTSIKASIKVLPAELHWAETSLVYNGKKQGPTATIGNIKNNDKDEVDDVTVKVEGQETNAGVYTAEAVSFEGEDASNYKMPQLTTRAFNIAKADATIDISINNWIYGDKAGTPTVETVPSGLAASVEYKLQSEKNSEYREWGNGPRKAGIYNIRASVSGNDNYNVTSTVDTFIIDKRVAELQWTDTVFIYDGNNHMPTATVANIAGDDTCNVTVTGAATAPGNHIATAIKFTGEDAANYEMPDEHSASFTIRKADIPDTDAAVTIEGWTYGDTPNTPNVSGNVDGANVTYEYKPADAEDSEYSNKVPSEAGEYVIKATIAATAGYNEKVVTDDFTISRRAAVLKWGNTSFKWNGEKQVPGCEIKNLVSGDECEVTVEGAESEAGAHIATASGFVGADANNYSMPTTNTIGFTISKNALIPTVTIEEWTYGEDPEEPVVNGNEGGGNVTFQYRRSEEPDSAYTSDVPTEAGTYVVKATIEATEGHDEAIATAEFTIEKKTVGLKWNGITFTYDGKSHAPKATVTNPVGNDVLEVSVTGDEKNAGEYVATADRLTGDKAANYELPTTVSQTYVIAKATLTVSAKNYTIDLGDPAPEYEADITGFAEGESVSDLNGTLAFDCLYTKESGAGTYVIEPDGVTSDNYDITFVAGILTVRTSKAEVTLEPQAASNVYDGRTQELVTLGKAKNGTIYYRLASGKWSNKIPEATKAGEYTVTWYLKADENYTSDSSAAEPAGEINVTIEPRQLEFTWGENEFVYNGKDQCPELTIGNVAEGDSILAEISGEATAVGTHKARVTGLSGTNTSCYKMPEDRTCTFIIVKADTPEQTDDHEGAAVSIEGWVYGETPNDPEVTGNISGANVTFKYKEKDADDETYSSKKPEAAGEYTVKATIAATAGYNEKNVTDNFTIAKAPLIVIAKSYTIEPRDPAPEFEADTVGFVKGDDVSDLKGTLAFDCQYTKESGAGTYDIEPAGVTSNNYDITFRKGTLTVKNSRAKVTSEPQGVSGVYDGKIRELVTAGEAENGTIYYRLGNGKWSDKIPEAAKAGEYTVDWYLKADKDYTSDSSAAEPAGEINVTIEPRELEFTWGDNEFVYNGKDQCPEVVIGNVAEGDSIEAEVSGEATAVGSHKARVTGISGTNVSCYTMPLNRTCEFTILKADTRDKTDDQDGASVAIEGWTYGDTPNAPEVTGNVSGANVTFKYKAKGADDGTYSNKVPKTAGAYTVKATIAATESYNEKVLTADFAIARRQARLVWSNLSFTYDGKKHSPAAVVDNRINGDRVTVTVEGGSAAVGKHTAKAVKITGENAESYQLPKNASHSFEIKAAPKVVKKTVAPKFNPPYILKSGKGNLMPLKLTSSKQTKRSAVLKWRKVSNASKYVVYGNRCDTKGSMYYQVRLQTTTKNSFNVAHINGLALSPAKSYKFTVVAYNKNNKVVERSATIHVVTKGGKLRNYTGLKIANPAKGKAVITKGKALVVKATAVGNGVPKHNELMYQSSNSKVARVTKNGKIVAVEKGKCDVYVCTQNGIYKTIKVTVK